MYTFSVKSVQSLELLRTFCGNECIPILRVDVNNKQITNLCLGIGIIYTFPKKCGNKVNFFERFQENSPDLGKI